MSTRYMPIDNRHAAHRKSIDLYSKSKFWNRDLDEMRQNTYRMSHVRLVSQ